MAKKKMDVEVKKPSECTPSELQVFQQLVEEGGEVSPLGLRQRIEQAEALVFVNDGGCIAVAAIKQPNKGYKSSVFLKAGVAEKSSEFNYELGWLYVKPEARGKGLGHVLMQAVVTYLGSSGCYATSREENTSMQYLFSYYNFSRLGSAYLSDKGYFLVLYASRP